MKAGMSDDAELFIKPEEAPVSLIDQGRSQTAIHMLSSHTSTHKWCSPSIANLLCRSWSWEQRCQRADGSITALFFWLRFDAHGERRGQNQTLLTFNVITGCFICCSIIFNRIWEFKNCCWIKITCVVQHIQTFSFILLSEMIQNCMVLF